jgi:DNA-binding transcriptional regulator of glucitol operon
MTRVVRAALAMVVLVAAVAVMLRLSLWQWDRARASGRLLNYTYAVEWLLFAVLIVIGVVRLAIEDRRRRSADPVAEARQPERPAVRGAPVPLVGPPLRPGEELQEITWLRLSRRLGLGGGRP